jgi:hypothetical protein
MNFTYQDDLKSLLELIQFKQFHRYGQVLYAKYPDTSGAAGPAGYISKPELTLSELAWGFCRTPAFAVRLNADLDRLVPDCDKYSTVLSKANRLMTTTNMHPSFDYAMRDICAKPKTATVLTYSVESTSLKDVLITNADGTSVQILNATDEDGELWHGLYVHDNADWNKVDSITVGIKVKGQTMWQQTFSRARVMRRTKTINDDVTVFTPFKHPMILLGLGVTIETRICFEREPENEVHQIFGVGSNDFCKWLSDTAFEVKLTKGNYAVIDMPTAQINFRI